MTKKTIARAAALAGSLAALMLGGGANWKVR
jgi:hypothetical protein